MSLFQCDHCGCCENTALACQGFKLGFMQELFDWSYAPERRGKLLCSACGPLNYRDGKPTRYGKWHGEFERVFLPKGKFETNNRGNLASKETGSEDFRAFALRISDA